MSNASEDLITAPDWSQIPEDHVAKLPHNQKISIAYNTFGDESNPCILLIQDVGSPGLYWTHGFCGMLAREGFFVVRYDQRDSGCSSCFTDPVSPSSAFAALSQRLFLFPSLHSPPPYTLQDLARDAIGLLDTIGVGAAHFVGYSLGSAVVQQILVDYPNRVHSASLIATFPSTRVMDRTWQPAFKIPVVDKGARAFADAEVKYYKRNCGSYPFPSDQFLQLALWAYDRQPPSKGATERQLSAALSGLDRTPVLGTLNQCCINAAGAGNQSGSVIRTLRSRFLALINYRKAPKIRAITASPPSNSNPNAAGGVREVGEGESERHIPVVLLHGAADTVTPLLFAECLSSTIPGALLVVYPHMGHTIPPALYRDVADEILHNVLKSYQCPALDDWTVRGKSSVRGGSSLTRG